ncbi:MAG: hypothetical protein ACOYOP_14455 [Microthrixaceae bacterium]
MTIRPELYVAPPGGLHHLQVKLALGFDEEHPARPATLVDADGGAVELRYLDGTAGTVTVADPERLAAVLARDDLCRLHDRPLLLVNTHHRVLALATGPATPPSRLEVLWVSRIEDGTVVELLTDDPAQPTWQTFAVVDDPLR